MMPYEEIYGQQPCSVVSYLLGTSKVNVMDMLLQNWETTLVTLKENLEMAQNHMKQQVNKDIS